jgi:hypothetical protein
MSTFYSNAPLPDTNARQLAQTIRPSSTALLTIDSEDRYATLAQASANPTSPYNFAISKTQSLMPGFMTRLGVSEIVFPWTIPNVNLKTNKIQVAYSIGSGPIALATITLVTGFYTPAALAAAMQVAVRALPGNPLATFAMEYGNDLFGAAQVNVPCFTYTADDTGENTISFFPMQSNSAVYPYNSNTKQLYDLLGFTARNSELSLGASGNFTLCQAIRYVDIVCNQLTNSQAQKDQTSQSVARDMLCRIYLGSAPGIQSTTTAEDPFFCPPGCAPTTLYKNYTTPKQIQWIPNQNIPGYLQFQVYDDAGDLLDYSLNLPGTDPADFSASISDWSMTMLISEC